MMQRGHHASSSMLRFCNLCTCASWHPFCYSLATVLHRMSRHSRPHVMCTSAHLHHEEPTSCIARHAATQHLLLLRRTPAPLLAEPHPQSCGCVLFTSSSGLGRGPPTCWRVRVFLSLGNVGFAAQDEASRDASWGFKHVQSCSIAQLIQLLVHVPSWRAWLRSHTWRCKGGCAACTWHHLQSTCKSTQAWVCINSSSNDTRSVQCMDLDAAFCFPVKRGNSHGTGWRKWPDSLMDLRIPCHHSAPRAPRFRFERAARQRSKAPSRVLQSGMSSIS